MERDFFLTTKRIGFSEWQKDDIALAEILWGNEIHLRQRTIFCTGYSQSVR